MNILDRSYRLFRGQFSNHFLLHLQYTLLHSIPIQGNTISSATHLITNMDTLNNSSLDID